MFFSYFFLYLTHRDTIFSLKNVIFCKNFVLKYFLQALFQSAQHIYEKREGSGSGSVTLTNGSGFGKPKNMRVRIPNAACMCGILWPTSHSMYATPPAFRPVLFGFGLDPGSNKIWAVDQDRTAKITQKKEDNFWLF